MSAAKHTPGPWKMVGGQFVAGEKGIIAGVIPWHADADESAHNLVLIVAAPALADALEGILSDLREVGRLHKSLMDAGLSIAVRAEDALRAAGRLP